MRRIVLYFGSFNPVHNGHTAMAGWVARQSELCDEVWLVVSPQNPLRDDLAPEADRLEMAKIAVREQLAGLPVTVSDVEFGLSKPSYTIDTLCFLSREYPGSDFSVLAGADVWAQLPRWKEHERLVTEYRFLIYPRAGYALPENGLAAAPELAFSSTDVRRTLEEGGDAGPVTSAGVAEYIERHGLWRPTTAAGWIRRGRLLNDRGMMGDALSAFLRAVELEPDNVEAAERVKILREIFAFRYLDYYNP